MTLEKLARETDKKGYLPPCPVDLWDRMKKIQFLPQKSEWPNKDAVIDSGLNVFLGAMLDMGMETEYSCEGHPRFFYITFYGSRNHAERLLSAGHFFNVEVESGPDRWSLRSWHLDLALPSPRGKKKALVHHALQLRWAAAMWQREFKLTEDKLIVALSKRFVLA